MYPGILHRHILRQTTGKEKTISCMKKAAGKDLLGLASGIPEPFLQLLEFVQGNFLFLIKHL